VQPRFAMNVLAGLCILSMPAIPAQESKPQTHDLAATNPNGAAAKAKLEAAIPDLMRKGSVPGLQVALIENGQTYWLGNFGVKSTGDKKTVTNDTVFEAASLSKPVFAYGVLKLVDQGKLNLDAPLTTYLPKPYIDGDDRLQLITARYVMSHRTGFPNWRGDTNALAIRFTPGERFSYSGEGFVYLQKVVEQITGKPLNDYMTEAVFAPLGMKSSSYVWRPDFDALSATGHDTYGDPQEKFKPKDANAAASLHTTAGDYALFVEAILNGKGLRSATINMLESPQIAVDPACTNCTGQMPKELSKNIFWGLGWGITKTANGDALWHWGDNGAFKCFVIAYPKHKKGLVFFTNSETGLSIAQELVWLGLGVNLPPFAWIKYDAYNSPSMQFSAAVHEKGATAAITEFSTDLQSGKIPESSLNSAGYLSLRQKKFKDALEIFQLNVRLHPDSWNAYDSLAEAQSDNRQKDLAIQNYQKSLDLNPNNKGAAEALKKLRAN
jgi:CubicO group peptidase (beta-lactamase class C family)